MKITGDMLIGSAAVRGAHGSFRAFDPAAGQPIEPAFGSGGTREVDRAAELAAQAFDAYRSAPFESRAALLEAIADNIEALGEELLVRAQAESGLPVARLQGERARTTGQLRLFAKVVRDGHFLRATIDSPQPGRQPLPRPDLRLTRIPVGPVAVFGASNFPLAFSVAGGDTAAALAAGCPVIVKAHNAHPGTSELVGRAVQKAVQDLGLPEGVFSLLFFKDHAMGQVLVSHPAIQAVGFTGSRQGGLALMRAAQARPVPIPVYAEMSSINPVFLMPAALASRAEDIARGFADSLTLGAGQFCTNPGLVLGIDGPGLQRFLDAAAQALGAKPAATMLTAGIHEAYGTGLGRLDALPAVQKVARGLAPDGPHAAQAALYAAQAGALFDGSGIQAEVFGPAGVVLRARDFDELLQAAEHIEGQLTATLHLDAADYAQARRLVPVLERKAGRLLVNGFPTGVEVSHAMVHGGPFPATSNGSFTSVGSYAIDRFLRPVSYQDFPDELLPDALKADNPLALWRLVDGEVTAPARSPS